VRTPVQVGQNLDIAFTFRNLSTHPVSVPVSYGGMWVVVKSADGTTYDTRVPVENESGPGTPPISLPAGGTRTEHLRGEFRVRWEGPLHVTPGCGMPPAHTVRVAVTSPGLPRSPSAAVADVVAATSHLLDHCRPRVSGVSVVGRIDPPMGDAPPLRARCSVSLDRKRGFYDAQVLVVTPPDLPGAGVRGPYQQLTPLWGPNDHRNAQVLGWEFVVTRAGATSVYSADAAETVPGGWAPEWIWATRSRGGGRCGFAGGGFGGVDGPVVSFVSACGR
jgi:hypothetical protein